MVDMVQVLFVTWDGGGNLPPALGMAAELRRRGDSARFLGHEGQRAQVEAAGFEFEAYRRGLHWSARTGADGRNEVVGLFRTFTDRGIGDDLLDSVSISPVDRIVIDCMLFGALQAAGRAGLPYIVLMHSLFEFFNRFRRGLLPFFALPRRQNARALWRGSDLILVTALPDLDPAHDAEAVGNCVYVGPVVTVGERVAHDADPVVLVSLSTTNLPGQANVLQRVMDALAMLNLRGVVTTGPAIDPSGLRVPASVDVHEYLPHSEVMNRVNLVVGHGGHGTTMQALAHDLPLVLLPLHPMIDQPLIARILDDRGAAIALRKSANVRQIADAITRALTDPALAAEASVLGTKVRACGAASRASDAIHEGTARIGTANR